LSQFLTKIDFVEIIENIQNENEADKMIPKFNYY